MSIEFETENGNRCTCSGSASTTGSASGHHELSSIPMLNHRHNACVLVRVLVFLGRFVGVGGVRQSIFHRARHSVSLSIRFWSDEIHQICLTCFFLSIDSDGISIAFSAFSLVAVCVEIKPKRACLITFECEPPGRSLIQTCSILFGRR